MGACQALPERSVTLDSHVWLQALGCSRLLSAGEAEGSNATARRLRALIVLRERCTEIAQHDKRRESEIESSRA